MKRLNASVAHDVRLSMRFRREIRLLSEFSHSAIVTVFDFDVDSDPPYYVMEYSPIGHLGYLAGRLNETQVLDVLTQLVAGLTYIHEMGIIHRDVKPENILVFPPRLAKLADFGIGIDLNRSTRRLTSVGAVIGTHGYAAPELRIRGLKTDHRADIYSLGIVVRQLLVGDRSRFGYSVPNETKESLLAKYSPILNRASATNSGERHKSCEDFLGEMRAAYGTASQPSPPRLAECEYQSPKTPPLGMVLIPSGTFLFGRANTAIYVPAFYIDRFPVTNAGYAEFVKATGRRPPTHWDGVRPPTALMNHPVTHVSWDDANEYAAWKGKALPTEQQWEAAARGVNGNVYPWGNEFSALLCNSAESGRHMTTPVDAFPAGASSFGVFDLVGNVWEWLADWYSDSMRVQKGGSFFNDLTYSATFYRAGDEPQHRTAVFGFRCVASFPYDTVRASSHR